MWHPPFRRDPDRWFLFTIARDLGMTVHELLTGRREGLSSYEYEEWAVYYRMEAEEKKKAAQRSR